MNERPLITCYVLTYKNFEHIYSSIQSILDQDYPNIEFGVFDDGSENFPKKEIEDYVASHKRDNIKNVVIWSNKKNLGTVKNLNNMISMTRGELLIGVASDDALYDEKVCSKLVDFFVKNDADIVTSYRTVTDLNNTVIKIIPKRRSAQKFKNANPTQQYKMIAMGAPFCGAGTYYSRRILNKLCSFDEKYRLQEDGPFFLRATRNGYRIHFYDGITLNYMLGNGVSSGNENNPMLVRDVIAMFDNEIIPYIDNFNFLEKRRIKYQRERIKEHKTLTKKIRIKYMLKYPDVLIYRFFRAH